MSILFHPLHDFSLLLIEGPDSQKFLQGQLTCDVVNLPENHWVLGACCNAKGRMVANFLLAKTAEGFWLRLPSSQIQGLVRHLSKYSVFFKAKIRSLATEWGVFGYQPETLDLTCNGVDQPQSMNVQDQCVELHWPDGRCERWMKQGTHDESLEDASLAWQRADIQLHYVWVSDRTSLEWLPQDIAWTERGGVSFTKGCYTGQEIVARLQYLGKSKKRLQSISSDQPLRLDNSPIVDDAGKTVGTVVAWQATQGLAILPTDGVANLRWQDCLIAQRN